LQWTPSFCHCALIPRPFSTQKPRSSFEHMRTAVLDKLSQEHKD
jgi:hypothetical protein